MLRQFDVKHSSGFAVEIDGAVAGFHAILSISLDAHATARSSTVAFHEAIHERILMRTPDGFVHLGLKQLSVAATASEETRQWASRWCSEIEQCSAIAHETIATYCGIKQADVAEHDAAIEALPPEYLGWFRSLADRIDSVFYASYVQYLLGWFVGELCFSTSFSHRVSSEAPGDKVILSEDEKPDARLARILETLCKDVLGYLLENLKRATGLDIQNEAAWDALPHEERMQLDLALSKIIREWGAQMDFGVDSFVAYSSWGEITGKVARRFNGLEGGLKGTRWLTHEKAEACRLSETTLINRQMSRPLEPEILSDEQLTQLSDEFPAGLTITSTSFSGEFNDRQWLVALEGQETDSQGVLAGGLTSTEGLVHLLRLRKAAIDNGRPQIPLTNFLVGVATQHELADHMARLLPLMSDAKGKLPPASYGWDWLLWYLSGDYIGFIDAISNSSDHIAFLAVPLSFSQQGNIGVGRAPGSGKSYDLVLHIAHMVKGGSDARFVRILNPLASGYAISAEEEVISNGRAERRSLAELPADAFSQFARIVGLIEAVWPEY